MNIKNTSKQGSMHNKNLGFNAESIARKWYEKRGWTLANQNSRTRNSELDLVMYKLIGNTNKERLLKPVGLKPCTSTMPTAFNVCLFYIFY